MKDAKGEIITKKMRVTHFTLGTASFLNIMRQILLSTPVFTKAAANIRLPIMNQQASSQYSAATSCLETTPVKTRIRPTLKATPGRGMHSVIKQKTTKTIMATATFIFQAPLSAAFFSLSGRSP